MPVHRNVSIFDRSITETAVAAPIPEPTAMIPVGLGWLGILFLRQRECVQRTARGDRYILLAIHRVGHRRSDGSAAGLKMP